MSKIQVGYGSDRRSRGTRKVYGGRTNGKKLMNGGFGGQPTVDYSRISDERWAEIFGKQSLPKWKQDEIEKNTLD